MNYEPKIVYNPTNKKIEFMCDRMCYIFEPGEKRILEGFVAYHALFQTNSGLVEYDGKDTRPAGLDYDNMPWRTMVSLASEAGIFKPGMRRDTLIRALRDLDGEKTATA